MAYVDTPRTDAGNATFTTNQHNADSFSKENSLLSPVKRRGNDDLLLSMRNGRGNVNLKTPGARMPLADRRNIPAIPARQEFTPLLHSVAKKNLERSKKLKGAPDTPAFLKGSLQGSDSPALPIADASALYGSELGSSIMIENGSTPIPQVTSSSAQSTPLATLPKRDAAGMLNEQGNLMTLREQENIINKIEKENFGLKLKIHFLEESLRKSGPGFNEAALQENTDLKVDRITLQKELVRCKKMLSQAERDVEALRRHIAEVQEQAKHKKLDAQARRELETLQAELVSKDHEIEEMRDKIQTEESKTDDLEKLRVEIEELASDLRDKDRMLEERDDEIETIKARTRDDCAELEDELDEAKRRIEELEEEEENAKGAASDLQRAKEALQDAEEARDKAEANLDELQEEMANKSITTKGLSRQIEEKAIKLEDDLINMREMYSELQQNHEEKARDIIRLQEVLKDRKQDADVQDQRLRDQNELLRNENESLKRRAESADRQVQQADEDLRAKAEAKDLLHSRHDALTTESQQLQKDLRRAQALSQDLQRQLELEKGRAQQNELELKSEARDESARLVEEVSGLRKRLDDHSNRTAAEKDAWQTERRNFETQKKKMEEQASGLQRTISRLQETEGNLSDKESQIRRALESEKQRHHDEEAILEGQVKDLNADVAEKRQTIEELRREVSQAQERQREGEQDRNSWEDRVQSLEDEIVVLQAGLDEEAEKAQEQIDVIQEEANTLRSQLDSAKEQLSQSRTIDQGNIEGLEKQLEKTRSENQSFHDRLATKTLELQTLQASMMNVEAERDELQSQLKDLQSQVDDTFRIDQDKIQIRSAKLRLEKEVDRLRGEQKCLKFEVESLERLLADESKRNHSEQAHLNDKIQNLQQEATTSRRSDVADSRTKIQRLEARIADLQEQLATTNSQEDKNIELSVVHKDLSAAREKEIDLLEREAAQKSKISNLKQQLDRLQRQIHEAEIARLGSFSPESVDGSARKNEIVELRRQLVDTQKELKDTRSDFRKDIQTLQKKLTESEQQIRQLEEKREQKEADIFSAQQLRESLQNQNATSIATISRLRTRIASLEKDPRTSRPRVTEDDTIAEERRDLHELLKDAKLEAEDLQNAIGSKDSALSALASREKELRANLKRMREERSMHEQKSIALASELDRIQHRHEKAVDQFSRRQLEWDQERRAMVSRVRFPNTSFSELHGSGKAMDQESKEVATQHMSELRGLAKQIQWLKARCQREKDFRAGLVYEKNFLLMRIGMFEACNATDLQLLTEMGVNASTHPHISMRLRLGDAAIRNKIQHSASAKRPSLRAVALCIVAQVRMKRIAEAWAKQRKVKEILERKLETLKKSRKGSRISG